MFSPDEEIVKVNVLRRYLSDSPLQVREHPGEDLRWSTPVSA
jgi:hypothetical protein